MASEQSPVEVSVVIPCLNEANSIGYCVEKAMAAFQAARLRGEVVVSDNGSTDGSIELAAITERSRTGRAAFEVRFGRRAVLGRAEVGRSAV